MLESLRGLGPYLRRHRRPMALGIACAAVADLCSVIPPLLLGKAVDFLEVASKAGETDRFGTLALFAAAFVGVVAFGGVFAWAMRRLMTGTSRRIEADLQQDLFCHLMRVPPATHDRLRGGDLISRLTNDVAAVREVLGPGIMWSIQTGTQLLLVAAFMLAISPSLTVYALAPLPLLLLVTVWASRGIHRHSYAAQESLSNLSQRATTAFSGIRVVQVFRREAAERADFAALDTTYVKEMLAQARVRALFLPAMTGLPGIALAAVLWGGGHATIADELSKGQLLTFLFYVVMLVRPMLYLGWAVTIHQRGAAALERLREVLRELPEDLGGDREPDGAVEGRLAWTACTVGYQADRPVLQTLDLAITPGEFCAVVGPIASGKSSLLQTLPRLLDPPRGMVTVDGIDVRDWPLDRLRREVGVVPQLPFLFSASVRENIRLGTTETVDDDAVAAAATAAGLDPDLAEWPDGLDTVVGERGVAVSGGQRQRIAIARALVADPPILLLDDCLSSLDAETAESILARLREARQGRPRTTMLATHRLAEAARCDRIVVLDRGRVVQSGTHAELATRPGLYARLVERQRLEAEIEGEI